MVGSGGMDLTPLVSDAGGIVGRSGGPHFDGTGEDCELCDCPDGAGKGTPCLAEVSRPGFWKTGPESDLPSFIDDGGGFQAGLGACRIGGSGGGRKVGLGWFWGVGWNAEDVGFAASALNDCKTADALLPTASCFWPGKESVEGLAPVDHETLGVDLGLLGLVLLGNGGTA